MVENPSSVASFDLRRGRSYFNMTPLWFHSGPLQEQSGEGTRKEQEDEMSPAPVYQVPSSKTVLLEEATGRRPVPTEEEKDGPKRGLVEPVTIKGL